MDELFQSIDFRLKVAGVLNEIIKSDKPIVRLPKTTEDDISSLIDGFLREHVKNLLKEVMGEARSGYSFSEEELMILKAVASKIRSTSAAVQLQGEHHHA